MDINELQALAVEFSRKRADKKGFKLTPELSYIHLTEEVGEIARQLFNKESRPELYDKENLKEEVIDVILVGMILSDLVGVKDLSGEIRKKLDALNKRYGFSQLDSAGKRNVIEFTAISKNRA